MALSRALIDSYTSVNMTGDHGLRVSSGSVDDELETFISRIPATSRDKQVKAITELDEYRLRKLVQLSHDMMAAAFTFKKRKERRSSRFLLFKKTKSETVYGTIAGTTELNQLHNLKLAWQTSFCEAYSQQKDRINITPKNFYKELEWIWSESIPLSFEEYLPKFNVLK